MKVQLKGVRLAFPDLFKPRAFEGSDVEKYGATFLLDKVKDAEQILAVRRAMTETAIQKWTKEKLPKLGDDKKCLRDGDLKDFDGFDGTMYIHATSNVQQAVVDGALRELNERSGLVYAGCYVNASIDIWAQDNKFGKRINATLGAVQFAGHGEAFSGGAKKMDPASEFEAYEQPAGLDSLDREGDGYGAAPANAATGKTVQDAVKNGDDDLPF
jgi:hypothetical protein